MVWIFQENNADNRLMCSAGLFQVKDFSVSPALPPSRCTRSWEGAGSGQLTLSGHRDIPHHGMPGSAHQLGGLARRGWLLLRNWLGILSKWWALYCAPLVRFYFSLSLSLSFLLLLLLLYYISYWTVFISTHEFYYFSFWFSSPPHRREREPVSVPRDT